ncbi:4a-hydroxytetrahydrobiopterin dehydratase [Streptomyces aidingensis]|uniref:Putative pterin-4-alpha-carbinolamine dehydratase n=1 Tax=Streptomyces aidingensis TaxID=910347 RepID=A0A1I1K1C5_9ACTN|nr:4a-hydroxytetrahydrobiopterin dehydratase [Streptomyces aidingensis]SFC54301.1 4a-hydroxytetrahydrobiopterin dehydratase [Streptomyces aidingensis]
MPATPLTESELQDALAGLPGWTVREGELTAVFKADRARVPALYAAVAAAEDEADHHARVTVLYGTVGFAMNTHDAGGAITARDIALATRITALADEHGARLAPA